MKRGITAGAFDLLHAGHILFLRECKKQCDYLTVALQVDPSFEKSSKNRPVQSVFERYMQLNGCKYVDEIIVYQTEQDLEDIFRHGVLNIRFNGSDHQNVKFSSRDLICQMKGIEIVYIERDHRFSTSELRMRVTQEDNSNRSKSEISKTISASTSDQASKTFKMKGDGLLKPEEYIY